MNSADRQAWLALAPIILIGAGMAWAGSQQGVRLTTPIGTWPVFALCAAMAFAINWLAFSLAWRAQTERYYDLTGSLTYVVVTLFGLATIPTLDPRRMLLADIEGGEIVPVILDIRSFGNDETHLAEDRHQFIPGLHQRVQPAFRLGTDRQGHVNAFVGELRFQLLGFQPRLA